MCKSISNKFHSNYIRTIKDCSILGKSVTLVIRAKKAFCLNMSCKRKKFTERLSSLAKLYSRVTIRLEALLEKLAFSVSAEQASKLAIYFGASKSSDYFLRLIRKSAINNLNTKEYINIGIDDFVFRKGCNYGSLICDLDTKKPIDVLDSRNTESFKNWLKINPQIEIVSRDRATTYTKAIDIVNPMKENNTDASKIFKSKHTEYYERFAHFKSATFIKVKCEYLKQWKMESGRDYFYCLDVTKEKAEKHT